MPKRGNKRLGGKGDDDGEASVCSGSQTFRGRSPGGSDGEDVPQDDVAFPAHPNFPRTPFFSPVLQTTMCHCQDEFESARPGALSRNWHTGNVFVDRANK